MLNHAPQHRQAITNLIEGSRVTRVNIQVDSDGRVESSSLIQAYATQATHPMCILFLPDLNFNVLTPSADPLSW